MHPTTTAAAQGPSRSRMRYAGIGIAVVLLVTACTGAADDTTRAGDSLSTTPTGSNTPTQQPSNAQPRSAPPSPGAELCFDEGKPFQGEARVYIEHNATDRDTGFHGMFDQEGLVEGCLQTPDGTQILLVDPVGSLGDLGINQFFFESREPPNDEYSIADLKADFPEGDYRISGIDFKGTRRVGAAVFTHAIPRPPKIVEPKLVGEEKAESNRRPTTGLTIDWEPVSKTIDGEPVDIAGYEVIVTQEEYDAPNSLSRPEYDVHVPADLTELAVPDGFLQPDTLYEVEVLALEKSGNQTIRVGFFTTEP